MTRTLWCRICILYIGYRFQFGDEFLTNSTRFCLNSVYVRKPRFQKSEMSPVHKILVGEQFLMGSSITHTQKCNCPNLRKRLAAKWQSSPNKTSCLAVPWTICVVNEHLSAREWSPSNHAFPGHQCGSLRRFCGRQLDAESALGMLCMQKVWPVTPKIHNWLAVLSRTVVFQPITINYNWYDVEMWLKTTSKW